ncbi:MAG UNVERIFIED_CONTAM: hypothetical protein LVR18_14965 [Planctomycetaceae bacterium]
MNGADGLFLVSVDVRDFGGNPLPHMRVKESFGDQGVNGGPAFEGA